MNTSVYPAYALQAWNPFYKRWLNVTLPDNRPRYYNDTVLPAYQRLVTNAGPEERYRTVMIVDGKETAVDGPSGTAI